MGDVAREADSCVVSGEFVLCSSNVSVLQQKSFTLLKKSLYNSFVSDAYICLCPAGGDNLAGMT